MLSPNERVFPHRISIFVTIEKPAHQRRELAAHQTRLFERRQGAGSNFCPVDNRQVATLLDAMTELVLKPVISLRRHDQPASIMPALEQNGFKDHPRTCVSVQPGNRQNIRSPLSPGSLSF